VYQRKFSMKWIEDFCPTLDKGFEERAIERQSQLTKPPGSLGLLEEVAIRLAKLQQCDQPTLERIAITVFAADHGVVEEGVSAFPQEVTQQMVINFLSGGAAISVLAEQLEAAKLEVVDVGVLEAVDPSILVNQQYELFEQRAGAGTLNSSKQAAMTHQQLESSLQAGYDAIERAMIHDTKLFIGGEMGIGNTTSAAALYCALLSLTPEQATGAGTGLDSKGIEHKTAVVKRIIETHKSCEDNTLEWLRCVGGFEIVALTGAYIRAAQRGLPVLVDGFICSVAALCAVKIQPATAEWFFFSHVSAEHGHRAVLNELGQRALLDLDLRLGEGSGAAIAAPLMRTACALHNNMATFSEAAVATKI
jgi:nicotinate-nucleotide--dimethylbenzimidazole phosphoribosyltransferase